MKTIKRLTLGLLLLATCVCALQAQDAQKIKRESIEWLDIWAPQTNNTSLPRVLLIGNSIARLYRGEVEKQLEGKANVVRLSTSKSIGDPALLEEISLIMRNKLNAFREKMFKPERLMNALFSDKSFVEKEIKPAQMMGDLFNIAEDMQCQPELNLSFDDLFTKDELFDIWQNDNASWCYGNGFFKSSTPRYKAHYNLLRNILDTADKAIKDGKPAVTLRFGHDSVVSPLAYILHLKGCDNVPEDLDNLYKYWANFKIIPMAGNIQLIFYRKANSNDILVKFLQNEQETSIPVKTNIAPYYHWTDVEAFYRAELEK